MKNENEATETTAKPSLGGSELTQLLCVTCTCERQCKSFGCSKEHDPDDSRNVPTRIEIASDLI